MYAYEYPFSALVTHILTFDDFIVELKKCLLQTPQFGRTALDNLDRIYQERYIESTQYREIQTLIQSMLKLVGSSMHSRHEAIQAMEPPIPTASASYPDPDQTVWLDPAYYQSTLAKDSATKDKQPSINSATKASQQPNLRTTDLAQKEKDAALQTQVMPPLLSESITADSVTTSPVTTSPVASDSLTCGTVTEKSREIDSSTNADHFHKTAQKPENTDNTEFNETNAFTENSQQYKQEVRAKAKTKKNSSLLKFLRGCLLTSQENRETAGINKWIATIFVMLFLGSSAYLHWFTPEELPGQTQSPEIPLQPQENNPLPIQDSQQQPGTKQASSQDFSPHTSQATTLPMAQSTPITKSTVTESKIPAQRRLEQEKLNPEIQKLQNTHTQSLSADELSSNNKFQQAQLGLAPSTPSNTHTPSTKDAPLTSDLQTLHAQLMEACNNGHIEPISQPNSALALFETMKAIDPNSPIVKRARTNIAQAYLNLAREARQSNDWQKAESWVEKAIAIRTTQKR